MKNPERPLVILQDTREPSPEHHHRDALFRPWVYPSGIPRDTPFADRPRALVPTVRATLETGDYSLPGLEHRVVIERKGGDLISTLFGVADEPDALGEAKENQERFRAELVRARDFDFFAIVIEADEGGVFRGSQRRWKRHGKGYDPENALALLRSFTVDFGFPIVFCSSVYAEREGDCATCRGEGRLRCPAPCPCGVVVPCDVCGGTGLVGWSDRLFTARQRAELYVGSTLARIWSQATGGRDARTARERGLAPPWLGVLEEKGAEGDGAVQSELGPGPSMQARGSGGREDVRGVLPADHGGVSSAQGETGDLDGGLRGGSVHETGAPGPGALRATLAPLGGMTASTADALARRSRKQREPGARRGRSWSRAG